MNNKLWSEKELNHIKNNLDILPYTLFVGWPNELPYRSLEAIRKKHRQLKTEQQTTTKVTVFSEELVDNYFGYNHQLNDYSEEFEDLPKKDFFEGMNEWFNKVAHIKPCQVVPPVESSNYSLGLVLSDLHFGKITETFNIEVAKKRIKDYVKKLLENNSIYHLWLNKEIDEIVLMVLGDLGEGEDIFPTQNGSVECSVFQQHREIIKSLWQLILDLEVTFKCVVRVEFIPGNHGRMSKTANEESNWDNAIENTLLEMSALVNNPNIKLNQNFKKFKKVFIKGHPGWLNHKGTKHQGTPAMQVKSAGWIITKDIEWIVSGHNHQWSVETFLGRPIMKNGSLCGGDDLAEEMAKDEPARQGWFLVKKDSPISNFGFIQWD